ncbi:putative cytochrome P450 9f2 [Folsomia candida]|uniref:Putative cytochrome P450 9f2 n=1 Tax=Folsomia candida TaxID=158441 RepID=A0A226EDF7_FOLCA|nr:putative cytochrome P450 9f2 [Folsomia candida]
MFVALTLVVATVGLIIYILKKYEARAKSYWTDRGFASIPSGLSFWDIFLGKKDAIDSDVEIYQKLGQLQEKVGGVMELGAFSAPILFVRDLDVAKDILIKDFDHFFDRRKSMRRYTLEVIGTAVFGMSVDTFNENDILYKMAERIGQFSYFRKLKLSLIQNFPKLSKILKLNGLDQDVSDFFWGMLSAALKARQEGNIKGNDFVQMLVDAHNDNLKEDQESELSREEKDANLKPKSGGNKNNIKWSNEIAIPQAFVFMSAGFDTVANNLAVASYILATHEDIQDKVYEEACRVLGNGEDGKKIAYEEVNRLEYIDMFISEVLRLYPAVTRLDRKCMRDYTLSTSDGEKPQIIKAGTFIAIPAEAIQRDEQYYPDPLKFDPERFNQENKTKRNPYAYMPFGIGPRKTALECDLPW